MYYIFDDKLCKHEGMTKEEIINAIAQATGVTPSDIDEGFISTIVETNRSRSLHIWKGTQAEYNALETHDPATFYIIDDDTTIEDLQADFEGLRTTVAGVASDLNDFEQQYAQDTADSGWISFKQADKDGVERNVGSYRIIGKQILYSISFVNANFDFPLRIYLPIRCEEDRLCGLAFSAGKILVVEGYGEFPIPGRTYLEFGVFTVGGGAPTSGITRYPCSSIIYDEEES